MFQVTINEAQKKLIDLINAAMRGEEVFIMQNGEQVAQIVPVAKVKRQPQFGSAKGLIRMADDFDAPLDDFADYMQ
ncbi:MAG: type II toxin-antitoxin system Phd/YefM family antitoxin [Anaerolineae bacterium]|nr:type II toxin-antitoxin system Phd/YefM family antitoxin [Anaerolineae bacterium]